MFIHKGVFLCLLKFESGLIHSTTRVWYSWYPSPTPGSTESGIKFLKYVQDTGLKKKVLCCAACENKLLIKTLIHTYIWVYFVYKKYTTMPTRYTPLLPKEYYHVYNRWYDKGLLFHDRSDFKRFYDTIIRYNKEYRDIKILSYCFLPNHFHFIITSESGLGISDFMRKIQQWYAMYYRSRYKNVLNPDSYNLKGPLFEWRFKAKHIDSDEYLAQCIAYVNYNPLKHDIVQDIAEYLWTSYHQLKDNKKIVSYKDMILWELEY